MRRWFFALIASWALVFRQRAVAFDCYRRILMERPDDTLTMTRIAFLHAEAGDTTAAIRGFEQVVALRPGDADSWFNLGYLRQQQRDHAGAIDAFAHSVGVNERHDLAWYGQGTSLIAQGRYQDAIAPLKKNAELQPLSPHGHMELARAYFKMGDRERCEKRMRKLMTFDPKNAALLEDETGIKVGVERWWKR